MKKNAKEKTTIQVQFTASQPLAEQLRDDLRQNVMLLGLEQMSKIIEEERTLLCGERYQHDAERHAVRGGSTASRAVFGGQQISLRRPRVIGVDGKEIPLKNWETLTSADPLNDRAVEHMVVGVATRKYRRTIEPLPKGVRGHSTSHSSVSRRFVKATTSRLLEMQQRPLGELNILAVIIDGIHYREHVVLCALGVDSEGHKHVLGLAEGATENAAACKSLLNSLVERGLSPDQTRLFVIDGGKGLRRAISDVFGDRALVQRCQVHKIRNVREHLPKSMQASVTATMHEAYNSAKPETAKRLLQNLARRLEQQYPGAAGSLREGLDESLTILAFSLPKTLARSLSTTNAIENMNGRIRDVTRRVKRWRTGTMILRWTTAALNEAEKSFRRLKGFRYMPLLAAALKKNNCKEDLTIDIKVKAA